MEFYPYREIIIWLYERIDDSIKESILHIVPNNLHILM